MQVTKAVITAAGRGARQYPASNTAHKAMLPLVDRDGLTKPLIQIIAEEALDSGIEEICVVVAPGDEEDYRRLLRGYEETLMEAFKDAEWAAEQAHRLRNLENRLSFAVQDEPLGYGHAVWCARKFVGSDAFLLLLGDHLYISGEKRRCARQVIDLAAKEEASVCAVQATRENQIGLYGTVTGKRVEGHTRVYQIDDIVEKPDPSLAEMRLLTPGLRAGYYLCLFGMNVLTPSIFSILEEQLKSESGNGGGVQLTPALYELAKNEKCLALETAGRRYNITAKFGMLEAQLGLALSGADRDQALTLLTEVLLEREQTRHDK